MSDDNFNIIDPNFFLPKEDIFSVFLNASENKNSENMNETLDQFFKSENNLNIFNNFLETNIFKNAIEPLKGEPKDVDDKKGVANPTSPSKPNSQAADTMINKKRKRSSTDKLSNPSCNRNLNFDANSTTKLPIPSYSNTLSNVNNIVNSKNIPCEDYSSFSYTSESTEKRAIFKTFKGEDDSQIEMKKMMRLMKNRLSARKCRQKKKNYVHNLEAKMMEMQVELDKYKNMQKKEKQVESMIGSMDKLEKEIAVSGGANQNSQTFNINNSNLYSNSNSGSASKKKTKADNSKKEYKNIQKLLITELLKKMIKNITPIDFKIFSSKFLKLKEFEPNDNLDKIIQKIEENIEM